MTLILCSQKPEENDAAISFSGNYLAKFGFKAGDRVLVDISKGRIVIKTLNTDSKNSHEERS